MTAQEWADQMTGHVIEMKAQLDAVGYRPIKCVRVGRAELELLKGLPASNHTMRVWAGTPIELVDADSFYEIIYVDGKP